MGLAFVNHGHRFNTTGANISNSNGNIPSLINFFGQYTEYVNNNKYFLEYVPINLNVPSDTIYWKLTTAVFNEPTRLVLNLQDMTPGNLTITHKIFIIWKDTINDTIEYGEYTITDTITKPTMQIILENLGGSDLKYLFNLNKDLKNDYVNSDVVVLENTDDFFVFDVGKYTNLNVAFMPAVKSNIAQNFLDYNNDGNGFIPQIKLPGFTNYAGGIFSTLTYNKPTIVVKVGGSFESDPITSNLDIILTEDYSYIIEGKTYYTEQRPYLKVIANFTPENYPFENIRNKVLHPEEKRISMLFFKQDKQVLQTKNANLVTEDTASILFGSSADWTYSNKQINSTFYTSVNRNAIETASITISTGTLKKEFTERFVPKCVTAERIGTYTITLTFDTPGIENFNFYNLRFEDTAVGLSGERLDNADLKNIGWG